MRYTSPKEVVNEIFSQTRRIRSAAAETDPRLATEARSEEITLAGA
jgi:hypothetical protein